MAELRSRAGSALLLALWALSLWLVGYYTLLFVVGYALLPVAVVVWLVAAGRLVGLVASSLTAVRAGRAGSGDLAGLGVPVGVSAAALVYVAWRAVALVASI